MNDVADVASAMAGSYVRGFVDNGGQYWAPGSGRARARTRGRGGAGKQAAVYLVQSQNNTHKP